MGEATAAAGRSVVTGAGGEEALRRRMYWLLGLTFLHVFGEGGLGLYEAIRTGSLALLAFSIESAIEGGAALLAVRHLKRLADEEADHALHDRRLARWIGVSFLLLGGYVLARGVYELSAGSDAEESVLGLFLTLFASFGMPIVGLLKWRTAKGLRSQGLAAEAKESISCSALSFLTLLAMVSGLAGGPPWLDPALSLLMVPWFLREGLAHVRGRVHAHLH
ncbi:MAG: cation transporter [Thermoanaerobaculia bacterium]|nr:cation transporter [Thermoanaerobaculia bacterium]